MLYNKSYITKEIKECLNKKLAFINQDKIQIKLNIFFTFKRN